MYAHVLQAFSMMTVRIRKIYQYKICGPINNNDGGQDSSVPVSVPKCPRETSALVPNC